jgi:CcmD family protein
MEGAASGTPFLVAGYLITWAVLIWYVWRLERRSREARRAIDAAGPARRTIDAPGPRPLPGEEVESSA